MDCSWATSNQIRFEEPHSWTLRVFLYFHAAWNIGQISLSNYTVHSFFISTNTFTIFPFINHMTSYSVTLEYWRYNFVKTTYQQLFFCTLVEFPFIITAWLLRGRQGDLLNYCVMCKGTFFLLQCFFFSGSVTSSWCWLLNTMTFLHDSNGSSWTVQKYNTSIEFVALLLFHVFFFSVLLFFSWSQDPPNKPLPSLHSQDAPKNFYHQCTPKILPTNLYHHCTPKIPPTNL